MHAYAAFAVAPSKSLKRIILAKHTSWQLQASVLRRRQII
jgi:hypothetical protein